MDINRADDRISTNETGSNTYVDDEEESYPVHLYVYDLTRGMARQLSQQLLGIQLEGVWHTSVVVHGREIFYGQGIQQCLPAQSHHGYPQEIIPMGRTYIPPDVFEAFLEEQKEVFTAERYSLFDYNCNSMTQQFCEFLVGKNIPDHIRDLPRTVSDTPFGQMLRSYLTF